MQSDLKNRTTINSAARASSAEALDNVLDLASPSCASNDGSCFKENININKFETPKLAVEPVQMKRKKKGRGYNLRKSLAWDIAFFTEEGVLDPLELSIISGAPCRAGLPVINEDTHGGSQLPIKAIDLQKLENNLLKEQQDEDLGKDRKKVCSSPKLDSSSSNFMTSTYLTSHIVPNRVGSKSGSRSGDSPPPLPSSSLKRPANVNVGKAAGKELKLPKVPGLKPGLSPICATSKSTILRENRVKHNQRTQPDFNVQRNAGLKSSCQGLKNAKNASTAGSMQSSCYSDGNLGNSSFSGHSSVKISPAQVGKADSSGPKMILENMTPATSVHPSESRHESTVFSAPFPQNAHGSGRTMHPLKNQLMKPSGLRMPSPSLSFFSQPESLVFRDLLLRGRETDVRGSQKPGNLRFQDPESTISTSKALSSKSESMASSHSIPVELLKPNLGGNPMQKIENLPKKSGIEGISHEEAEFQKIDSEVLSQSGSYEQVMGDNLFKKAMDSFPVKSESSGSGSRNPGLRSQENYAVHVSKTISAIDEQPEEKNKCKFLVLKHGAIIGTQCEEALDHGMQNSLTMKGSWEETTMPDYHELHREQTYPSKYSIGETDKNADKDKNVLKTKEIASEPLGMSWQNRSWCSGSASIEALEHRRGKAENSYFVSKHLCADRLKEAASAEVLTDNLLVGEVHIQNAICGSTIGDCKNNINLISEAGDDTKQLGKVSVLQTNCLKVDMDSQRNVELNTSDGLLPEKQTCLQKPQQGKNVEKLLFISPEREYGNKVIDTKMTGSLSSGEMHDCIFDQEEMIGQPLISTEHGSIGNSLSSESRNNLINMTSNHDAKHKGNTNVLLDYPANESASNTFHQDNQRTEIDYYNSFPESRTHEVSQKDTLGKVTEGAPIIQDGSANNWLTSTMSLKQSESDMGNLRNARDLGTLLVLSPESNMLNECCFSQSESLALANAEFIAENLAVSDEGLHFENCLEKKGLVNESLEENALGSMEDSVTRLNEIYLSILKTSSVSAQESPFLKHESCNDARGTEGQSCIADAITNPSGVKPLSGATKSEVFEDTTSSFSCVHPKLECVKVEAALAPKNKHGDVLNEKSSSFVLPQNAIPFSDEWLAAIEAAGEDILTRKSGAVQNSPPDKSLPEQSPWSPVKRKNNQIGPFDCTKFTNVLLSDSN